MVPLCAPKRVPPTLFLEYFGPCILFGNEVNFVSFFSKIELKIRMLWKIMNIIYIYMNKSHFIYFSYTPVFP